MSPWQINRLGNAVQRGAVIAYPTDTIWGFGCHPLHRLAIRRILQIKQRPVDKGLILLASDIAYLEPYLNKNINAEKFNQLGTITSQPTTWLVEADSHCPYWLRGQFSTIAVRLTEHPFVQSLCDAINAPLISTSANRCGRPPIRNAIQARRQFADELDFIVDGFSSGARKASEIKSLENEQIIRPH